MTYVVLSAVFIAAAVAVWVAAAVTDAGFARRWWLPSVLTAVVLIILTAVFDNLMIAVGLMTYAPDRIWGVSVGAAPLEDFAYPIAAVILLPALWSLFSRRSSDDA
jgi:lycopene cyclase domain-containing protein